MLNILNLPGPRVSNTMVVPNIENTYNAKEMSVYKGQEFLSRWTHPNINNSHNAKECRFIPAPGEGQKYLSRWSSLSVLWCRKYTKCKKKCRFTRARSVYHDGRAQYRKCTKCKWMSVYQGQECLYHASRDGRSPTKKIHKMQRDVGLPAGSGVSITMVVPQYRKIHKVQMNVGLPGPEVSITIVILHYFAFSYF